MSNRYILIVLLITIYACHKKSAGESTECTPEEKLYSFGKGKQIDLQRVDSRDTAFEYYNYTVKDGNKIVFSYVLHFRDCPQYSDDEGSSTVVFEIPDNLTSFQLKDSADFRNAKVLKSAFCLCYPSGPVLIKKGSIEGQQINNSRWHVKASIQTLPNAAVTWDFEGDYVQK